MRCITTIFCPPRPGCEYRSRLAQHSLSRAPYQARENCSSSWQVRRGPSVCPSSSGRQRGRLARRNSSVHSSLPHALRESLAILIHVHRRRGSSGCTNLTGTFLYARTPVDTEATLFYRLSAAPTHNPRMKSIPFQKREAVRCASQLR